MKIIIQKKKFLEFMVQGTYATKKLTCLTCQVYTQVKREETTIFKLIA
jgi:hypothetical protein